jgi:hypothetical protein
LLQSLLAPGTVIPDGAVAHVSLGSRQLKAAWQEHEGSWDVTDVVEHHTPSSSVQLSLLFLDLPVARLPPQHGAEAVPSRSGRAHRVSLLLRRHQSAPPVTFTGSDASSAPSERASGSDDDAPVTVQCVARGCWGTVLPVAVAGVEVDADGQDSEDDITTLTALTVGVSVPCTGSFDKYLLFA